MVDRPSRITRRRFLFGAGSTAAVLAVYPGEIARHEIDVVHRPISLRNLPEPFHGFRIAQISDIHLDQYTEPGFVERVVRHINTLAPDMVVLTGDFVSCGPLPIRFSEREAYRCGEILRTIACPLRYAVLGNHDTAVNGPLVTDALTTNGIPVLIDRYVPIERGSKRLWLGGVNDPATEDPHLDLAVPEKPDGPVILMAHEPDYVDDVLLNQRAPLIDLMLCGHTHGGQVRLPLAGALYLPPMGKKYVEGLFHFDHLQLYVNRGIGTVGLPLRLNCPPEITLLTLQPA